MERYYIKVKGLAGSVVAHDTLADAYAEARRLFDLNDQTRRVYVLQVIGTIDPEVTTAAARRRVTAGPKAELGTVG